MGFDGTRYLVVWAEAGEIYGKRVEPNGNLIDSTPLRIMGGESPDVAASAGMALFAWRTGSANSANNNIAGRLIDISGNLGASFMISDGPEQEHEPAVGWNGSEFVVAWSDKRNAVIYFDERSEGYAARITLAGAVLDPAGFAVGDRVAPEILPAITSLDNGRTVIAMSSFREDSVFQAYRIGYEAFGDGTANRWPVAVAAAWPSRGDVALAVSFDRVGSYDPDGSIVSYEWDFGDGGTY